MAPLIGGQVHETSAHDGTGTTMDEVPVSWGWHMTDVRPVIVAISRVVHDTTHVCLAQGRRRAGTTLQQHDMYLFQMHNFGRGKVGEECFCRWEGANAAAHRESTEHKSALLPRRASVQSPCLWECHGRMLPENV